MQPGRMQLAGANVVVYGGGGEFGGGLALALASHGARIHLAGRSRGRMDAVVDTIRQHGGHAEAAVLDVLDEVDVDEYVDVVAACSGSIDLSIDVIVPGFRTARTRSVRPVDDTEVADLERPVLDALRGHFITARAAARHMTVQHYGSILVPRCIAPVERLDALALAGAVIDRLAAQLAAELSDSGVRVLTVDTDSTSADSSVRRALDALV